MECPPRTRKGSLQHTKKGILTTTGMFPPRSCELAHSNPSQNVSVPPKKPPLGPLDRLEQSYSSPHRPYDRARVRPEKPMRAKLPISKTPLPPNTSMRSRRKRKSISRTNADSSNLKRDRPSDYTPWDIRIIAKHERYTLRMSSNSA